MGGHIAGPGHLGDSIDDQPLADHQPYAEPTPADPTPVVQLTVEQVLEQAELPERTARICLKPAIDDQIRLARAELATLVDAEGKPLDDEDETSLGQVTGAARAAQLEQELQDLTRRRAGHIWPVRFRGISADDMAVFNKRYYPTKADKDGRVDLTDFNNRLISECAIEPTISITQVIALRGKLGSRAFAELAGAAQHVCVNGGVDVPK